MERLLEWSHSHPVLVLLDYASSLNKTFLGGVRSLALLVVICFLVGMGSGCHHRSHTALHGRLLG